MQVNGYSLIPIINSFVGYILSQIYINIEKVFVRVFEIFLIFIDWPLHPIFKSMHYEKNRHLNSQYLVSENAKLICTTYMYKEG